MRVLLTLLLACGGCDGLLGGESDPVGDGGAGSGDGTGGSGDGGSLPGTQFVHPDDLESAGGCGGVYNPDQVLELHLAMAGSDWTALQNDTTASVYFPAMFRCGDEAPLMVGVRRKRSGTGDKIALKVDINTYVDNQEWHTLRKLSLEVGAGAFAPTSMGELLREYAAWRVMRLSDAKVSRSALSHVFINDMDYGVMSNVEQVDKRFLYSRVGDDSGWLYGRSGGANDGYKTNETTSNPYEADWCIFENNACPAPADLETWLPQHLAIEQLLAIGAVNAVLGNADAPISKANNFYSYDYAAGPRFYFPWDLDSVFSNGLEVFPSGTRMSEFQAILFTSWEDDYDGVVTALLNGPLSIASVHAELDRIVSAGQAAIDSDPILGGDAAGIVSDLKSWYTARHAEVSSAAAAH